VSAEDNAVKVQTVSETVKVDNIDTLETPVVNTVNTVKKVQKKLSTLEQIEAEKKHQKKLKAEQSTLQNALTKNQNYLKNSEDHMNKLLEKYLTE
jgi:cell division protein ZapA (FtsZ GTPase activity inhibitor)